MAYAFTGQKYGGTSVSYYIDPAYGYSTGIREAFASWDSHIELDFVEVFDSLSATLVVDFGPLDGAGGTLGVAGWSFGQGGIIIEATITFDGAENWANKSGVDLYLTALHEIGHTLGLEHSGDPATVMNASISPVLNGLSADDITGAQILYGAESSAAEYILGWVLDYTYGWELGEFTSWAYGWHVGWNLGWYVGGHEGWYSTWGNTWVYETSWGWSLGWGWGYQLNANSIWEYTYNYGWNLFQTGTWTSAVGWTWAYGWTVGWTVGWNVGWTVGWYEESYYGWHQAWGWHYVEGWVLA